MVDVVCFADAVSEVDQIADRSDYVLEDDVLRAELLLSVCDGSLQLVLVSACLLDDVHQDRIEYLLRQLVRSEVHIQILCRIYEVVSDDLCDLCRAILGLVFLILRVNQYRLDAGILDDHGHGSGDSSVLLYEDLACVRVDDILCSDCIYESVVKSELAVVLEPAYLGEVIAPLVEEQGHQHGSCVLNCWRLSRSQSSVKFSEAFCAVLCCVLFERTKQSVVFAEDSDDVLIAAEGKRFRIDDAESSEERCERLLSRSVDSDIQNALRICLVLEPCTSVRDDLRAEQLLVGLVCRDIKVRSRRTYHLRNDGSLGSVVDECALLCHEREISHEYVLLLDLTGVTVDQSYLYGQSCSVCGISLLALLLVILRSVGEMVICKLKAESVGRIADRRNVVENLSKALLDKPFVGLCLYIDEVRHLANLMDLGESHTLFSSNFYWCWHCFFLLMFLQKYRIFSEKRLKNVSRKRAK